MVLVAGRRNGSIRVFSFSCWCMEVISRIVNVECGEGSKVLDGCYLSGR